MFDMLVTSLGTHMDSFHLIFLILIDGPLREMTSSTNVIVFWLEGSGFILI